MNGFCKQNLLDCMQNFNNIVFIQLKTKKKTKKNIQKLNKKTLKKNKKVVICNENIMRNCKQNFEPKLYMNLFPI